jgi:diguanylate cyclase (GGDEF)-like protein/PAS domain S-box-containing protein
MVRNRKQEFGNTGVPSASVRRHPAEAAGDALIMILDAEGRVVQLNHACESITGYRPEEVYRKQFLETFAAAGEQGRKRLSELLRGRTEQQVAVMETKEGERRLFSWTNTAFTDKTGVRFLVVTGIDVTEPCSVEEALEESESRYRTLFEDSAVPLWEEDLSGLKQILDQLRELGVKDFKEYFEQNPEMVRQCFQLARILDVNQAALDFFNVATVEQLLEGYQRTMTGKSWRVFQEELAVLADGRRFLECETEVRTLDGEPKYAMRRLTVPAKHRATLDRVFVSMLDITKRKLLEKNLRDLAIMDHLTGILNRRSFLEQAERELLRSRRYGCPLSILFMDVDRLKRINDIYGNQAGDEVLVDVARRTLSCLRESDLFGRLGGEEFGIMLIESDLERAAKAAERLRQMIEENPVVVGQAEIRFTVSIGAAQLDESDPDVDSLLLRADRTMSTAKSLGGNQVSA